MRGIFWFGLILAALAAPSVSLAQMPPINLAVHQVAPNVYWAEGGPGNTGIIVGDKGVVVVDATMTLEGGRKLLAEVAKITPKPVTAVILTHADLDHVGGLPAFPANIQIIAQEDTRKRLAKDAASGNGAVRADMLPNHTVKRREALTIDGVRLQLWHWAPAHTDGDLVIYLPDSKVAFTGDIFAMDQPRALIHLEEAGSSSGWIESARGVVALDADHFVVGHGPVQTKAALQARVEQSADERARIVQLVAKKRNLTQIEKEVGDPPPGQTHPAGWPVFPPFAEVVYQELTHQK